MDPIPPLCDGTTQLEPTKFFRVIGTGNMLTASTCNNNGDGGSADFDTVISVFTSCGFQCVAANDDGPVCTGCFSSLVSWLSVLGEEYTIIVGGVPPPGGTVTGNFVLSVSE